MTEHIETRTCHPAGHHTPRMFPNIWKKRGASSISLFTITQSTEILLRQVSLFAKRIAAITKSNGTISSLVLFVHESNEVLTVIDESGAKRMTFSQILRLWPLWVQWIVLASNEAFCFVSAIWKHPTQTAWGDYLCSGDVRRDTNLRVNPVFLRLETDITDAESSHRTCMSFSLNI